MIPDAEKIVSDYLREHPAVKELVGRRVVGKSPEQRGTAWVRVTQLDAANETGSRVEHLISFLMQFDCYAGATGGQPEANLLGRTVRAALHAMPDEHFDGVVVTQVAFTADARIPDRDFEPARERRLISAIVRMHGAPVSS